MEELTSDELARYSRHLLLPQVGVQGQTKLRDAKVLLVGAGGLGSPLGLYLVAAGVGTVGIVDFDRVEMSNLHRQVIHDTESVGEYKTDSAQRRLNALNPQVKIITHRVALGEENTIDILAGYDLVIDGTDNFTTRYLVNDACVFLGLANIYGSIHRFEGQVSIFDPAGGGPCYRCLYPEPPPPELAPSCAEGGVLGVLPGVIGTLQATEAIKWLLGQGESLVGRLLLFDALKMRFRELRMKRDPNCPVCGDHPRLTKLVAYQPACSSGAFELAPMEFLERWSRGERPKLFDVRAEDEWDTFNLQEYGACLVSEAEFADFLASGDKSEMIVCYCRSGARSQRAVERLSAAGFENIWNLSGGVLRWASEVKTD